MNLDNERKAFEAWAYSNKWNICRYPKSDYHMKEGQYCDEFVDGAWHGWIKSTNREGYKLVPVEPDQQMIYAGESAEHKGCISVAVVYKAMIGACDE